MGSGMGHMGSALGTQTFVLSSCKSILLLWGGGVPVLFLTKKT